MYRYWRVLLSAALILTVYLYPLFITPRGLVAYLLPFSLSLIAFGLLYSSRFKIYEPKVFGLVPLFFLIRVANDIVVGAVRGFGRNPLAAEFSGTLFGLLRAVPIALAVESFRAVILDRFGRSYYRLLAVSLLLSLLENPYTRYLSLLSSGYRDAVNFIFTNFLPAFAKHVFLSILYMCGGIASTITFAVIDEVYLYSLPILPNVPLRTSSAISMLLTSAYLALIYIAIQEHDVYENRIGELIGWKRGRRILDALLAVAIGAAIIGLRMANIGLYVVTSGSMAPAINIGDVVVTLPTKNIERNDVIAFLSPSGEVVIHRVVDVVPLDNGSVGYITKGDANRDVDPFIVTEGNVIGRMVLVVRYIGIPALYMGAVFVDKMNFLSALFLLLAVYAGIRVFKVL